MIERVRHKFDPRTHKKCIKCRIPKAKMDIEDDEGNIIEKAGFGKHDSSDGVQSICFKCKNEAGTRNRNRNVAARIRHHTATRCLTQLGEHAPEGFTADLEKHLGYRIRSLVKHLSQDLKDREGHTRKLRDALNEGYHIDHKRPLSSFNVIIKPGGTGEMVDWQAFRKCWAIENLTAIPADENLAKGAKYDAEQTEAEEDEPDQEEADIGDAHEEEAPAEQEDDLETNPETRTGD